MKTTISILLLLSCQSIFSRTINSPIPPVELTSFTGQVENNSIYLVWTTATEVNNMGFEIERAIQIGQWQEIGFVEGNGTTNEPQTYEYKDSLINVFAEKLYYRLKQIDFDGTFEYSDEIEITLQQITLRDTTNQYDYIIITAPEFVNACGPFRQHKETVRNFSTLIVDTTQIFAEFDSSAMPQDNIRDFISYAGTFWKEPKPKFFLIAGTASDVPNFPIPIQGGFSAQSDYYYNQNIYENDSTTTDFYIGRIPSRNIDELQNYFDKVIDYESSNSLQNWMNNNLFICENDIQFGFLDAAISIGEDYLPAFIRSFYIVDDTDSIYYGNKDSIYKAINERGNAIVWFYGHSNDSVFISEDYFNIDDLSGLSNQPMYFLSIFASTQHSIIDTNTNMTAAMMMMSESGSFGGLASVGYSYWGIGNAMRRFYAQRLFDPSIQSLGEAFTLDNLIPNVGLYNYAIKTANLWADPSLKLKYNATVGVEKVEVQIPESLTLYQNYPNPFNPSTTIKFALPINSRVRINVYNSLGQLVETLVDKEMESGYHEVNFNASRLASGVYLYQLQSSDYISVKKMLLLK
jgi:hypothetical protein